VKPLQRVLSIFIEAMHGRIAVLLLEESVEICRDVFTRVYGDFPAPGSMMHEYD